MWRRNACLVAALCLHEATSSVSLAQQKEPATSVPPLHGIRFELVMGRLQATSHFHGEQHVTREGDAGPVTETLVVNAETKVPVIRYDFVDDTKRLHIKVLNRVQVDICLQPRNHSRLAHVSYVQPEKGPVRLSVRENGSQANHVQAASLWHLLLDNPGLCRQHLIPILEPLNPNWQLEKATERIDAELQNVETIQFTISRHRVLELLDAMDARSFARRQSAFQKLRSAGVSILPLLESLDVARMTQEQRLRLQRVCKQLRQETPDTPQRVVSWLQHDEAIWQSWIEHSDPDRKAAAVHRLAALESQPKR